MICSTPFCVCVERTLVAKSPLLADQQQCVVLLTDLSKADKMYVCMYSMYIYVSTRRCEGRKMRVRWSCFMFTQNKGERGRRFAGVWDWPHYPASCLSTVGYKTRDMDDGPIWSMVPEAIPDVMLCLFDLDLIDSGTAACSRGEF